MTFIFKTTTTMKEYNARKWWIDSGIVREIQITADNLPAALEQYREIVEEKHYISISANAIKNRNPMYIDTPDGESKSALLSLVKPILKIGTITSGARNTLICG